MLQEIEDALETANSAQQSWSKKLPRQRLKVIGNIAGELATDVSETIGLIPRATATAAEKIASEILPLADACRYTAKVGRQVLAPKSYSWRHGSWWMGRIGVRRIVDPWGIVLILAPNNYPLLLPGVQIIQALAAGNAVVIKPAHGCEAITAHLKAIIVRAGAAEELIQILPSSIEAGQEAIRRGVDKVVLTGSIHTGRAVLRQLAETLTPSTMELGGCDAMFVLPQADIAQVTTALQRALVLNGGATCLAPRRVFVTGKHSEELASALETAFRDSNDTFELAPNTIGRLRQVVEQALANGAEIVCGDTSPDSNRMTPLVLKSVTPKMEIAQSDLFAPVVSLIEVEDMSAAVDADRVCPYSLAASVFGPQTYAEHWAKEIEAGCVVVNDIVIPTADPRIAFGGRDQSGWGVTRGCDGLLEMTRPKSVCTRKGDLLPNLDKRNADSTVFMELVLQAFHANSWKHRFNALKTLIREVRGVNSDDKSKAEALPESADKPTE